MELRELHLIRTARDIERNLDDDDEVDVVECDVDLDTLAAKDRPVAKHVRCTICTRISLALQLSTACVPQSRLSGGSHPTIP